MKKCKLLESFVFVLYEHLKIITPCRAGIILRKHLYRNELHLCTVNFFYSSVVFRMSHITDPDPDPDIKFVICPGEMEWIIISDLYILHKIK